MLVLIVFVRDFKVDSNSSKIGYWLSIVVARIFYFLIRVSVHQAKNYEIALSVSVKILVLLKEAKKDKKNPQQQVCKRSIGKMGLVSALIFYDNVFIDLSGDHSEIGLVNFDSI